MSQSTRKPEEILIVDDHRLVRDILASGLESSLSKTRIDAVRNLEDALEHLERRPETDLVLLDYNLPDCYSTLGVQKIRGVSRKAKILMLSAYINKSMLEEIKNAGANGAVTKDVSLSELKKLIDSVYNGNYYFVAPDNQPNKTGLGKRFNLSRRELEAWSHLATGQRNTVIAARMGISESTVKVHLHNVFRKIGVHSRVEAYEFWRRCSENIESG